MNDIWLLIWSWALGFNVSWLLAEIVTGISNFLWIVCLVFSKIKVENRVKLCDIRYQRAWKKATAFCKQTDFLIVAPSLSWIWTSTEKGSTLIRKPALSCPLLDFHDRYQVLVIHLLMNNGKITNMHTLMHLLMNNDNITNMHTRRDMLVMSPDIINEIGRVSFTLNEYLSYFHFTENAYILVNPIRIPNAFCVI